MAVLASMCGWLIFQRTLDSWMSMWLVCRSGSRPEGREKLFFVQLWWLPVLPCPTWPSFALSRSERTHDDREWWSAASRVEAWPSQSGRWLQWRRERFRAGKLSVGTRDAAGLPRAASMFRSSRGFRGTRTDIGNRLRRRMCRDVRQLLRRLKKQKNI